MGMTIAVAMAIQVLLAVPEDPGAVGVEGQDFFTLRTAGLECVVGNNTSRGEHRSGYNGLFLLRPADTEQSCFVPAYAGLNLEHFFDARGRVEDKDVFFEPRRVAMAATRIDENTVELHQAPTPVYGVESWTRFTLCEADAIDFSCRLVPRKDVFEGGFFGVFWASYINEPHNKSMYFLDGESTLEEPVWRQFCTQAHDRDSTVRPENDGGTVRFQNDATSLFDSMSPLRYGAPFFYGRIREHVLIYVFKPNPGLRFSHSPSGGGPTPDKRDTCPAWDFQLIVPDYEIGREYKLEGRLVCKPWTGRDDVIDEVERYLGRE